MEVEVRIEYLYTVSIEDDQGVMAQGPEDLSEMMKTLQEECTKAGFEIYFARTEYLTTIEGG